MAGPAPQGEKEVTRGREFPRAAPRVRENPAVPTTRDSRTLRLTRVVLAEDSEVVRRMLAWLLQSEPEFVVVGEARDGVEAVEMTRRLKPDLVTMDIRMPRMDGVEAIKRIMAERPTPVVVVTGGTSGEEDAAAAILALRAGALAVLRTPEGPASPSFDSDRRRFLDTLRTMAAVRLDRRAVPPEPTPEPPPPPLRRARGRAKVVAVAASTGGPAALQRLFGDLPATFPAPVLLVQHMAPGFAATFARWLDSVCSLRVRVGEDDQPLEPNTVYLAPDDHHLGLARRGVLGIAASPPLDGFRPSATHLFRSVAKCYGPAALAVVLTGMGSDGLEGLRAVKAAGGQVLAQDEATSVVYGMPGAAAGAGLVDALLPLPALGPRVLALV